MDLKSFYEHQPWIIDSLMCKRLWLPDDGRRYWIREQDAEGDIGDMGEELGQMATEVKIAFPVTHNVLTIAEEYVQ